MTAAPQPLQHHSDISQLKRWSRLLLTGLLALLPATAFAHDDRPEWLITVNSASDTIAADGQVTLREAITFLNGDRPLEDFSPRERLQLVPRRGNSRIQFQLPADQTTLYLHSVLPEVQRSELIIDGTSQMQRRRDASGQEQLVPLVALTPTPNRAVPRGLTLVAHGIQVKGLSLYGFNQPHSATAGTLVANIVISHPDAPPSRNQVEQTPYYFPFRERDRAPWNITLIGNWIGQPPTGKPETATSAQGIYVLNAHHLTIQDNLIAHHQGAGILTGFRALDTAIEHNVLENNGTAGLPDAIRLEGQVDRTQIRENLIYRNGGSGIYFFKPNGTVTVAGNVLSDNGQRYQRAAIYVTGNHHRFEQNWLGNQTGPGIVVGAVPQSQGVQIRGNQFVNLQGLSIDLVAQAGTDVQAYQQGDGRNPRLKERHRRRVSANYGINAPLFAHGFLVQLPSGMVTVLGTAEPGSEVELYQVDASGNLLEPIARIPVNEQGAFAATLAELAVGDRLSAIAHHPTYGTSEPATEVEIRGIE
ncbi:MAG: right-handed parallel beta-helix repeat-containing protein [Cyanobacteria bacterium P01_G01_bin.54]